MYALVEMILKPIIVQKGFITAGHATMKAIVFLGDEKSGTASILLTGLKKAREQLFEGHECW